MYGGYVSSVNIDNVSSAFGQGLEQLEGDLQKMITEIQANPTPSQTQLLQMQAFAGKFQAVVQSESSILKTMNDMLKAVAQNIGT